MSEKSGLYYLPLLYFTLPPIAWFSALYLALYLTDLTPLRLVIYGIYALATTAVALACVALCRRSTDGKVPVMLVSLTYEAGSLAVALWGIFGLLITRLAFPALSSVSETAEFPALFLQAISYAMISGSAAAASISAVLLVYGLASDRLYWRISPSPWGAIRLIRSRSTPTD